MTLEESDIATYISVLELIPNDWQIRNNLAEELIELGDYNQAIVELDISLETTGDLPQSSRALELKEMAISHLE